MRQACQRFADSKAFQTVATLFTLFALFGDDLRLMATAQTADEGFDMLTITSIAIFTLEIVASSIGKRGYFGEFFFWLDCVATATLPLDITWVYEYIFIGTEAGDDNATSLRASRASRAGSRAGRVVRLIRLIRLLRIIKLYKLHLEQARKKERIKLGEMRGSVEDDEPQESTHESRVGKKLTEMTTRRVIMIVLIMLFVSPFWRVDGMLTNGDLRQAGPPFALDQVADAFFRYTETVQTDPNSPDLPYLKNLYEQKMLLLVYYNNPFASGVCESDSDCLSPALMLTTLFWVGFTTPIDAPTPWETAYLPLTPSSPSANWDTLYDNVGGFRAGNLSDVAKARLSSPWTQECPEKTLLNVRLLGVSFSEEGACPNTLRHQERQYYGSSVQGKDLQLMIYMNQTKAVSIEAVFNVSLTLFVVAVLAIGSLLFSRDANRLVLFPVERMMARMAKIRTNPFEAMKMSEDEYHRELHSAAERITILGFTVPPRWHFLLPKSYRREKTDREIQHIRQSQKKLMETVILEKTIIKLGGLCALGFGEAGSTIIASNMQGGQSADITVMVPGRKVTAIFGFCDIRNFTDATEILQDAVMVFVNQISEIVHTIVDEYRGAANKNIGDAFLLVWRLEADFPAWLRTRMADLSILCFLRIIAWTNRSPVIAAYRTHDGLLARMPNYRVRMGFGLHLGWAIEGAIGSEFKVDASYLSMNVNMASRLEAATKQYAVLMLFTDTLVDAASPEMQVQCRKIDRVMLKGGSKDQFNLFTMDLDYQSLTVYPTQDHKNIRVGVMNRCLFTGAKLTRKYKYNFRSEREARKKEYLNPEFKPTTVLDDEDIKRMRERYLDPKFQHTFAMAFYNYVAGEWPVARQILNDLQTVLPPPKVPVEEVPCESPTRVATLSPKKAQATKAKRRTSRSFSLMASKRSSNLSALGVTIAMIDGPSGALLSFMGQFDFEAPKWWQGYREMD